MKIHLKNQLVQQLVNKKMFQGFTLVELLVVVIVVGILTAISLPAYLSLAAKAKQSEARQNLQTIMTAQHLWLDSNSFGTYPQSLDELAVAVVKGSSLEDSTSSSIYIYNITNSTDKLLAGATPKDAILKSYSSGVKNFFNSKEQPSWYSLTCESASSNQIILYPTSSSSTTAAALTCPSGYSQVSVGGK